jgi:FixJ family two-component response regulator
MSHSQDVGARAVIAIVDDEEHVRKALVRVLETSGFRARGFASGREFLQSCEVNPPACVLLDLAMPELSGADVLRALNRAHMKVPVVMISAHEDQIARQECMREGAVAYLCKPLDEHALLSALKLAMDSARV